MSYAERIRHPSGALSDRNEKRIHPWLWLFLFVGVVIYFAWRGGAFGRGSRGAILPLPPPANPHGWV